MRDVKNRYTHVKNYIRVTLIEANEILSSFDVSLRQYALKHLTKSGVRLVKGVVKEVHPRKLVLSDGSDVPYGLLVWSTGVGPSEFVKSLNLPKSPGGRIGIDEWLCVPSIEDVFAVGDCAGFLEQTGRQVLPALAQVAEREGSTLWSCLTKLGSRMVERRSVQRMFHWENLLFISILEAWRPLAVTRRWLIFARPRMQRDSPMQGL